MDNNNASEAVKKKKDPFAFADPKIEKMMTKHGWNRGVGLGASQDGDAEFGIKVKRKYNKHGLGDDPGKDFKNQWWHKAYDNASNNIGNKCPTAGVTLEKPLHFRAPKLRNGAFFVPVQFVKRETLTSDDFVEDMKPKVSEDENDTPATAAGNGGMPTFEEMFDACNGLTIHKGARSGITHKGKLQRLQEQEAKMMKALLGEKDADEEKVADEPKPEAKVDTGDKKMKKKKKKEQKTEETSSPLEVMSANKDKKRKLDEREEKKEEETKKKKKKKSVSVENSEEAEFTKPVKKTKKKKVITEALEEETVVVESTHTEKKKKVAEEAQEVKCTKHVKKKKKKVIEEVESVPQQKKKKKVTKKSQKDDVQLLSKVKKKKEKKSRKNDS